jgi:hypothetical protein
VRALRCRRVSSILERTVIRFLELWQVTRLETKVAREKTDRAQVLQSLEEERVQVAAAPQWLASQMSEPAGSARQARESAAITSGSRDLSNVANS